MSSVLPAPPLPKSRETTISYLSRLAASKGVGAREYASDMGASLKRVVNQDDEALERMAHWGKLSPEQLDELKSWTGCRAGNVRLKFRGELYVSRSLRNPTIRGCPDCLREDLDNDHDDPLEVLVMRGHWQFREALICVKHHRQLVPLWTIQAPIDRYDFTQNLPAIATSLNAGELTSQPCNPTPYDILLDRRLENGGDETWLSSQTVYAVSTFCLLLGVQLQSLSRSQVNDDWQSRHMALSTGFDVVKRGEDEIRNVLNGLVAEADAAGDEPKKAFGALYVKLSTDLLEDPAFASFRTILRDCVLAHWPIGANETLLGKAVERRRLHSLTTASKETGIGQHLLNLFLVDAGAWDADDPRPASRKLFDTEKFADVLAEIPTLVGPKEYRKAIGATHHEFQALHKTGVLKPRISDDTVKFPWKMDAGLTLVAELRAKATDADVNDKDWETINLAARRKGLSVDTVINAIRTGKIRIGLMQGENGYHGIRIDKHAFDNWFSEKSMATPLAGTMSLPEFGRAIGFRDQSYFAKLADRGHISVITVIHPHNLCPQTRITEEQIAAFRAKFVTVAMLHAEHGLPYNTIHAKLRSVGVERFAPDGEDFGPIWLREEVTPIFMPDD